MNTFSWTDVISKRKLLFELSKVGLVITKTIMPKAEKNRIKLFRTDIINTKICINYRLLNSRLHVVCYKSTFIIEEPSKLGQAVKLLFPFQVRSFRVSLILTTQNSGVFVLIKQQPLPSDILQFIILFYHPAIWGHTEMQISRSRTAENSVAAYRSIV